MIRVLGTEAAGGTKGGERMRGVMGPGEADGEGNGKEERKGKDGEEEEREL